VQQNLFGPRGGVRVKNGRAPHTKRKADARYKAGAGRKAGGRRQTGAQPDGGSKLAAKRGPGRPPKGPRAGSPHKMRPELNARYPLHVVLRVVPVIGSLRKRFMYAALREATITVALRELHDKHDGAFRIVHISIQRTHVHLIVEADNKLALARGMQGFQISAAKHLNRAVSRGLDERRRGSVFPDRYHYEVIKNPTQARRTLAYVLNNWRKHKEDRGARERTWKVDPFSTGALFGGWRELADSDVMWPLRETYRPLVAYLPKTWMLRVGWQLAGPISVMDVPSAKHVAVAEA
jgi:REP element-mobilizing transposase RayT